MKKNKKEKKGRGNIKNLIKNEDLTPEERRRNASKAGKASVEARRKKKTYREILEILMDRKIQNSKTGEVVTTDEAILMAQVAKALKGNLQSAIFCRDTLGQNPSLSVKQEITGDITQTNKYDLDFEQIKKLKDILEE